MKTELYLVFDQWGYVKAFKTEKVSLNAGQRAIRLQVTIPDEAFSPAGVPTLSADVPLAMLLRPVETIEIECTAPNGAEAETE